MDFHWVDVENEEKLVKDVFEVEVDEGLQAEAKLNEELGLSLVEVRQRHVNDGAI